MDKPVKVVEEHKNLIQLLLRYMDAVTTQSLTISIWFVYISKSLKNLIIHPQCLLISEIKS